MKEEQRSSENTGWRRRLKRDVTKCLILDVLFRTKDVFTQAAWAINVESLGNTVPSISTKENKKSVGPVNKKLADWCCLNARGFRCLCGEPRRVTSLEGQISADTILINKSLMRGVCSRLRINNAFLDKCNISHVPNILRFTIAMVVFLQYRAT